MSSSEHIQKLRVKAAYLWGLGIGITITAFQLTPVTTASDGKHTLTAALGAVVLVAAVGMTWYVRRKETAERAK